MSIEVQAADPSPPYASTVFRRATAATSQRYEIPASWKSNFVTFGCKGEEVQILFGDSTVSATMDQVSSVSTEVLTANAASGVAIPADQEKPYRVPDDDAVTHFCVVAAGTSGFWSAYLSNSLFQ